MTYIPPRIVRRLVVDPLVVLLAAAVVVVSPLLFLAAAVADLFLPGRWRTLRLVVLAVASLAYEGIVVVALFALWVASGFGLGIRSMAMQSGHYALARWWLRGLFRIAARVAHLRIEVEDAPPPQAGPVLVFCRHAGPGDSILLAHTLMNGYRRRPRIVMKWLVQWGPGVDILGHRIPAGFVRPGSTDPGRAVEAIRHLATGLGDRDALVLFPEGTNFSPERRLRAIASLERRGFFEEADEAERMLHVIAPRTGGALAAIAAAPDADVVFVTHTGLEDLSSLRVIWRSLPLERPILARYWRLKGAEIPHGEDEEGQIDWLFLWWSRVDKWIEERRAQLPPVARKVPGS